MSFAFLFLIYDNFTDQTSIKEFIKNQNIYIHPKYPEKVNDYFKKYIIKNLVDTEWGTYSIVEATLNLLKEAYKNKTNEFFILLSQDSIPIYKYNKFLKIFNKIYENKSIFNYKNNKDNYWKTSQWWILKRSDVKIIIENEEKYKNKFIQIDKIFGAYDEVYFLSVLKLNNPKYEFTNIKIMYDKWLKNIIQKSPQYFNHLLKNNISDIKNNNSLFIRKILPNFSLKEYKTKKKLYIIYIGTETDQSNIIVNDSFDFIILISIKLNLIKKEIIEKAIYIVNIIYKFFYESILAICNEKYIANWSIIIFTSEKFNMKSIKNISKEKKMLPYNLKNNLEFYYINDNNNNLAFCTKSKYLIK